MEKSNKAELIRELNELSSDSEKNLSRMQEIARVLLREHFAPSNDYEYSGKRVCEYGLQIESCRQCLFDTLCNLKKKK